MESLTLYAPILPMVTVWFECDIAVVRLRFYSAHHSRPRYNAGKTNTDRRC